MHLFDTPRLLETLEYSLSKLNHLFSLKKI